MPTFFDESGDTGRSPVSSPFFSLAAVWMPDASEADGFREAMQLARQRWGLPANYEFKFSKTHAYPAHRVGFFEIARQFEFRFAACAINKTSGYWRTAPASELLWAAATSVAVDLRQSYLAVESPARPLHEPVWVDRNDDRHFLDAIATALRGLHSRHHPAVPLTGKPKWRKSHPDVVMQLVDMVCGAAVAHVKGDSTWFKIVEDRCLGLTPLP
ncbi:MAG: DUF3800 domain-containing protein [Planctomycetia bacterium]|nr:DUF3800 domain-containing protein [Planctomycetia bacterium]